MDITSIPYIPRYKSKLMELVIIIGTRVNQEDILESVYNESKVESRKKISSFLEDESYVMQNKMPGIEDTGFVRYCLIYLIIQKILPYTLDLDYYISVFAVKTVYTMGSIEASDILFIYM